MDNKKQPTKPNILFIMSDDHASHALSCYTKIDDKRNIINQTPNIDRIANEGMLLNNCFCTNSICTPSRGTIISGKYSHKIGVNTLYCHYNGEKNKSVSEYLKEGNYQTAMIGKWHLGHQKKKYRPKGFDYWCILPGQGAYFNPRMIEKGEVKDGKEGKDKVIRKEGYATDIITDISLDFLKKRDKTKPFFLMCHHKAPHRPWKPDKKHIDMYDDEEIPYPKTYNDEHENRGSAAKNAHMRIEDGFNAYDLKVKNRNPLKFFQYYSIPKEIKGYKLKTLDRFHKKGETKTFNSNKDLKNWKYQRYIKDYLRCIASIDDNVGRILDYIDEESIAENTIVIYTSDQGFFLGDHNWFDKRFMYEESLRMPFVIRYPKEIKPGTINKDIISNVDFAETFLDYGGIEIPKDMQGASFRPLLQGNTPDNWPKSLYYRYWENNSFPHEVYAHYGIRTLNYKLIYYYCDPLHQKGAKDSNQKPYWELFDLEKDPYELNSVYEDPTYKDIIVDLKEELHRLQSEVGDQPYENE
ncbi:MAG: sulfatase [archaeon]|nr:sulfatase [archaeon]